MLNQLYQIHYYSKPTAQTFCLSFTQQQKREGKKETNCLISYMKDCSTYISLKIQKQLMKILSNLLSSCPMVSLLFPHLFDCFCPQKFPWKQLLLPYFDHVTIVLVFWFVSGSSQLCQLWPLLGTFITIPFFRSLILIWSGLIKSDLA